MAAKRPKSREVAIEPLLATRDDIPYLQSRAWMSPTAVASFAEDMEKGDVFPPVSIIEDTAGALYLWDGWHRVEAALSLERQTIAASVESGTLDDALERALGANQTHGIRRTNEDKKSAIEAAFMLMDRRGEEWSDGLVAEKCGVSRPTVANWRERRRGNMQSLHVGAKRIGRDGRVRKAYYDRPPAPVPYTEQPGDPPSPDLAPDRIGMTLAGAVPKMNAGIAAVRREIAEYGEIRFRRYLESDAELRRDLELFCQAAESMASQFRAMLERAEKTS